MGSMLRRRAGRSRSTTRFGRAGFAEGFDLLLHGVWLGPGGEAGSTGHSAADDVAEITTRAGVRRLIPVHHHPRASAEDLRRLAAELAKRAEGVEIVLPEEGRVYEVGGSPQEPV